MRVSAKSRTSMVVAGLITFIAAVKDTAQDLKINLQKTPYFGVFYYYYIDLILSNI